MKHITFSQIGPDLNISDEHLPYSNSKKIPKWYRETDFFYKNNKIKMSETGVPNLTIKACVPFFDIISNGYTIPLWSDVFVSSQEGKQDIQWQPGSLFGPVVDTHAKSQIYNLPIPEQYNDRVAYKWINIFHIKTPPGYSCLFMNPVFQEESVFYTIPAIVDTDTYDNIINFPFLLNKNFEGIIKAGTPMVTILPFKRDSWNMDIKFNFQNKKNIADSNRARFLINYYRKKFWKPKKFT